MHQLINLTKPNSAGVPALQDPPQMSQEYSVILAAIQTLTAEIREMKEAQRQMKAEIDEIHAAVYSEEE